MSTVERQPATLKPIYDPRRALEHIQTLQGVVPVRLFAILFPLWDIETTARQEEGRPYELMEKYVERGIDEGQLHTVEELTAFFGLQDAIIQKILLFLKTIGHVTQQGTCWDLTALGHKSVRGGTKYVSQEKHVRFYFDAYTSQPLRKEHYEGKKVRIFSPEEAAEIIHMKTWGYRFHLVISMHAWRATSLRELEARVDRGDYNMPVEMREVQMLAARPAYLPMYVIETKRKGRTPTATGSSLAPRPHYLVYTGIRNLRDTYFERIINDNAMVYAALRGEKEAVQRDLWDAWLHEKGITGIPLERPDGTWQIALSPSMFEGPQAKLATTKVGNYDLRDGYFIQIWCDDQALRRRAALDLALRLVKGQQRFIKRRDLQEHLQLLGTQLQVAQLSIDDVRRRAVETKKEDLVKVLDNL
ncbi:MAG: hypothetical protein ABI456_12200 [Ktedonobacteraceae bacterium]